MSHDSTPPSAPIQTPLGNNPEFGFTIPPFPPVGESQSLVFLVDDQPMVGEAVRRALATEEDISFHYCSDFAHAADHAKALKPTVILQDLVMPGIDGLTLVQEYRKDPGLSHVPVIVLSTKEDANVKRNAFETGANDYLVKLPDKIELIARIRYHSKAYLHRIQRDEAYRALQESQRQLAQRVQELEIALTLVKQLQGLLPICAWCKNVRNDEGYWQSVEQYIQLNADVKFSHCVCPACLEKHFPGIDLEEIRP